MNDDLRKKIEAAYATFPQQVNDGVRLTKKELLNIIEHQEKPNLVRRGDEVCLENGVCLKVMCPGISGPRWLIAQRKGHTPSSYVFEELTTPDGRPVDGFEETMIELTDERIDEFCEAYKWTGRLLGDRKSIGNDLAAFRDKLLKEANDG